MNQEMFKALTALFQCPNWENRSGPWNDINAALKHLHGVYTDQKKKLPSDDPLHELHQWIDQYRDEVGMADHAALAAMDYMTKVWGRHGLGGSGGGVNVLGGAANVVRRTIEILQAFQGRIAIMEEMEKQRREQPCTEDSSDSSSA